MASSSSASGGRASDGYGQRSQSVVRSAVESAAVSAGVVFGTSALASLAGLALRHVLRAVGFNSLVWSLLSEGASALLIVYSGSFLLLQLARCTPAARRGRWRPTHKFGLPSLSGILGGLYFNDAIVLSSSEPLGRRLDSVRRDRGAHASSSRSSVEEITVDREQSSEPLKKRARR
eukprot:TRINITY_DN54931_c0_g1_i1.p1 TRINITY_DN54931_c0_g1~~TRINITY_DN54931_c0_g1_i1.p1  ORF type:complete len:176 (+),score=22.76 TRINITY_DN54931_c0_g1_i1:442-969(+)